jgi:hypothetical protein
MTKSLANSFGFVFLFGVLLLLFCIQSQDNVIKVVAPRPSFVKVANHNNNNNDNNNDNNSDNNNNINVSESTTTITASDEDTFPSNNLSVLNVTQSTITESTEKWPYDSPVVQGWEPAKSRNLSVYLQPEINTTLIMPRSICNNITKSLSLR